VNSTALQVLLYAFVAAASPVALASTLVVITGPHRRFSGLAFGIGVVVGQAVAFGLAFALGVATVPGHDSERETLRAALELACGVAFLVVAARVRYRPRPAHPSRASERSKAVLARLTHLNVPQLLLAGLALGVGGPKRLGITVLVAATISASSWSGEVKVTFALVYVVIATVLVWVPVLLSLLLGRRTAGYLQDVESWLAAHRQALTFYPLTVLGILVVVDAVVALL
jgi:Sap-like sulfolipid-1-addressing protein